MCMQYCIHLNAYNIFEFHKSKYWGQYVIDLVVIKIPMPINHLKYDLFVERTYFFGKSKYNLIYVCNKYTFLELIINDKLFIFLYWINEHRIV